MKFLSFLLIICSISLKGLAQKANDKVQIINIKVGNYTYPFISAATKEVSDRINFYILNSQFSLQFGTSITYTLQGLNTFLQKQETDGLHYEVQCNSGNILSLTISEDFRGKSIPNNFHCNFDLKTGYIISSEQIFNPSKLDDIKLIIVPKLLEALNQSKKNIQDGGRWDDEHAQKWNEKYSNAQQHMFQIVGIGDITTKGVAVKISHFGLGFGYRTALMFDPGDDYLLTWDLIKPYLLPDCPLTMLSNK